MPPLRPAQGAPPDPRGLADASDDPKAWRPQAFGRREVRTVKDPVIEPLWEGVRAIAHVDPQGARLVGDDGGPITTEQRLATVCGRIEGSLAAAALADGMVLDGYLTWQASDRGTPVLPPRIETPAIKDMTARFFVGSRSNRFEPLPPPTRLDPNDPLAFVAVDLLMLDGTPLLDVPLLERKRLLESTVEEGDDVRVGTYVRPPVDLWIGSWRALGFHSIAYKAANSRYLPGQPNDEWASIPMPPL